MANEDEKLPFKYLDNYPDASSIFQTHLSSSQLIKDNSLVVLDTNTLLVPFGGSQHSVGEIAKVYKSLKDQKRLIVPGHVAREFAENRTLKLKEIYQQLGIQRKMTLLGGDIPILEGNSDYAALKDIYSSIEEGIREYKLKVAKIMSTISGWRWDDPVSTVYREILDENVVFDIEIDRFILAKELEERNKNKMPPGYKDSAKKENSAGDLIIWKTILELGEKEKKDIVFVTQDGKPDWWSQADGRPLYPRFELIDEYRRKSSGKELHILKLSEILELMEAKAEVVNEIKRAESLKSLADKTRGNLQNNLYRTIKDNIYREYADSPEIASTFDQATVIDRNHERIIYIPFIIDENDNVLTDFLDIYQNYSQVPKKDDSENYIAIFALFDNKAESDSYYQINQMEYYPPNLYLGFYYPEDGYIGTSGYDTNITSETTIMSIRSIELPF